MEQLSLMRQTQSSCLQRRRRIFRRKCSLNALNIFSTFLSCISSGKPSINALIPPLARNLHSIFLGIFIISPFQILLKSQTLYWCVNWVINGTMANILYDVITAVLKSNLNLGRVQKMMLWKWGNDE